MVIVKSTSNSANWAVWHRSLGATSNNMYLNLTSASGANADFSVLGTGTMSSTSFCVSSTLGVTNASGQTYVAYLFAHDAGGFGTAGTDNVISCGSFAGGDIVNLGYEPQFLMWKRTDGTSDWRIHDNMRGFTTGGNEATLAANLSSAETNSDFFDLLPTGFDHLGSGGNYIYMAIRRPMKVPTTGASVFAPITYAGTNTAGQVISGAGFSPDLSIPFSRAGAGGAKSQFIDRLRGGTAYLPPSSTAAEGNTGGYYIRSFDMDGVTYGTAYLDYTDASYNYVNWMFKRASGFMDVVCYTGTGGATTVTHNLGVAPELMIFKNRTGGTYAYGFVYAAPLGNNQTLILESTDAAAAASGAWNLFTPTATQFQVYGWGALISGNIVAYLFASCPGVSKVGSYTGNGSSQTINCGFTAGARFVLIKRTDSTGDWYVWDTARGIISGNDPYLLLNSTAAEVTSTDYIDPVSSGFELSSTAPAAINASGGSYIFLAIA
jgi:hypothetical protein